MSNENAIREAIPDKIAPMIRSVKVADGVATIIADASGLGRSAAAELQRVLERTVGEVAGITQVRVALMADKRERIIIAVGSGKGGVGKSTLTANLAVALVRQGLKVGVVDADIYGPSQPTLLGALDQRIRAEEQTLIPTDGAHGVRLLSMGQLAEPGRALAWRGPMTGRALGQLMEADWGETEVLLVDLPPGTGDIQLTMLSKFKPAGAVIVSTPQDLALIDATRAIDLFAQAEVPIIGLVENMAGYLCPHCGEVSEPFGQGGAQAAAEAMGLPFLGRVPLTMDIRIASDAGKPPAAGDSIEGRAFAGIAGQVAGFIAASSKAKTA